MHSFASRADQAEEHPLKAYLYRLISTKKTNLCVSADVNTSSALLTLAEEVGDHICVLKTHADIIDDFCDRTVKRLVEISLRKRFLIFEDRKFGDIGSKASSQRLASLAYLSLKDTVQNQYSRGPLRIATWAHITNAHIFPGPAVVTALEAAAEEIARSLKVSVSTEISTGTPTASTDGEDDEVPHAEDNRKRTQALAERKGSVVATTTIHQSVTVSRHTSSSDLLAAGKNPGGKDPRDEPPVERGLLLLAQMSTEGNMMDEEYTEQCIETARQHPGFVMGFIAQEDLNEKASDNFITMTPGVSLPNLGQLVKGDGLGQQYRTPEAVIVDDGCDVIIVGRAIIGAKDRHAEAARYRVDAWKAYEKKLKKKG